MKIFLRAKSLVLVLGATLALTTTVARADDESPKLHTRTKKAAKVAKSDVVTRSNPRKTIKGSDSIPTRDDRHSQEVNGGPVGGANGPEYRVPTGSNLPKRYNRRGYTTDSDQNSFIFDKNDQRLRSHNNVSEALRLVPGLNVGGPRGN